MLEASFFSLFEVRRPAGVKDMARLTDRPGQKLHLRLRGAPGTAFRALAVPLAGQGVLLNLSFGVGLPDAVRDHALTDADFAPTDLAMELLPSKSRVLDQQALAIVRAAAPFGPFTPSMRQQADQKAGQGIAGSGAGEAGVAGGIDPPLAGR